MYPQNILKKISNFKMYSTTPNVQQGVEPTPPYVYPLHEGFHFSWCNRFLFFQGFNKSNIISASKYN